VPLGEVAQSVEHTAENRGVAGSIPALAIYHSWVGDAGTCDHGAMEQRISLITLGVDDVARARAFYEGLGWKTNAEPSSDIVFFQAGGIIVALWSREELAKDSGVQDSGGWGGITLAHNVRSPAEVDTVLSNAETAGATITGPAAETFWGGYSGKFVDLDGHAWEVAHNPHWTLRDDGSISL
jgi:predicted lactoylglutathione lyase